MTKILFICHGNICRSAMAKYVMLDLARAAGRQRDFEIDSAATTNEEIGNPVYPPAARELNAHGISCKGHAAKRTTRADYDYFDLIIAMDDENLWHLDRIYGGDPEGKVSLLMDHCGRPGQNVADPWYTRDFSTTYADVLQGCAALLEELA